MFLRPLRVRIVTIIVCIMFLLGCYVVVDFRQEGCKMFLVVIHLFLLDTLHECTPDSCCKISMWIIKLTGIIVVNIAATCFHAIRNHFFTEGIVCKVWPKSQVSCDLHDTFTNEEGDARPF